MTKPTTELRGDYSAFPLSVIITLLATSSVIALGAILGIGGGPVS